MPLTPTDVANKQFRIAFRGYSLDEVDAFLDEVETELSRLLRENAAAQDRPASAPVTATAAAPAPAPAAPVSLGGMEGQEAALRTLLLAQRTADEAIAEARAEAEQIVAAARAEADGILEPARSEATSTLESAKAEAGATLGQARSEAESTLGAARSEAETTLTEARAEADRTLTAARSEAETTLSTAQGKAARIDEDVAARIQAATGDLDERRRTLEARIEELRAFEREYRTRLKAYLETQLRDLDSRSGPDDGGAGVPAGARSAAVGLTPGGAAGVRPRPGTKATTAPTAPTEDDDDADAPAGPPREAAGGSSLRAVPPLSSSGPEPVGPFTVPPGGSPSDR